MLLALLLSLKSWNPVLVSKTGYPHYPLNPFFVVIAVYDQCVYHARSFISLFKFLGFVYLLEKTYIYIYVCDGVGLVIA